MDSEISYIESDREVIVDEPEYTFSYSVRQLDADSTMTMIHLDVYYMSPSILRQMLVRWKLFRACVPQTLFAQADVDDEKWERFIKKFGFQYLGECACTDNKNRRLFVNYGAHAAPKKLH